MKTVPLSQVFERAIEYQKLNRSFSCHSLKIAATTFHLHETRTLTESAQDLYWSIASANPDNIIWADENVWEQSLHPTRVLPFFWNGIYGKVSDVMQQDRLDLLELARQCAVRMEWIQYAREHDIPVYPISAIEGDGRTFNEHRAIYGD